MKFGRDGVVERTAVGTFLNDLRIKLLRLGENDPYAAFAAGIVRGLVVSIMSDHAHMDLLDDSVKVDVTNAELVQKLIDVELKGSEAVN